MTVVLPFTAPQDLPTAIEAVQAALASHAVIAVPTETFYGLAVDPHDAVAVDRVFEIKGRPSDRALPVVAASVAQVDALVRLQEPWRSRLLSVWPAPLSVVLPVLTPLPFATTNVAVRIPSHPLLVQVLERVGPLTATSANRSGEPPAETAWDVRRRLSRAPALVLDGGQCPGGRPSTLIDCSRGAAKLLRPGAFQLPSEWDVKRV